MKKYIIIIFCITSLAYAQNTITLEQAIQYGLTNSKDLAIAKNDVEIIKNTNHVGAAGLLPMINISSGYNGSVNDTELEFNSFLDFGSDMGSEIEASEARSSNINSSIGLTYKLFGGFSGIYTLNKFKNQNSIADNNIRYQVENKILEIIQQYYDLLNQQNIHSIFKTSYNISLDRYQQALEKHNYGAISKLDLLNAEVDLNQNKINLEEAMINLHSSRQGMSLLLGVPDSTISLKHEFNFNYNLKLDDLTKQTKSNNTSIIISELNYKVSEYELKIAKSSFSPNIDFFSSYSYSNIQSETSFISKQNNYGLVAGLNVEIPIFSANMRRKAFKSAKINLESKELSRKQIQETIITALATAYYNYSESLNNLDLLKKNLKTIEKKAQISRDLYDSGQLSNLEYRESQMLLDQAEINYSAKLSATKIQEYIIYQLSGQLQKK
ncbi:MAG: TolC family protein [Flavobacteriales bacterium TMED191]|nr:MAG: TolC family protein [Flavobacteriales bacterium TMED191]|tara:strand:+ start:2636 stop:3955 length:1320 start_codon:yes stop_codon:yes gene_type:complete